MKIVGTGLSGLVGSRVVSLLSDSFTFENMSRSTGVDITNREEVISAIASSDAPIVLHLAAKTNVDGCEEDKSLGKDGDAWKINVQGTKNVVDGCLQNNKKLIFVSTDFVFNGENPPEGGYTEEDKPDPINWYATTKYEAEEVVRGTLPKSIIIRIAYPYKANGEKDFVSAVRNRLQAKSTVAGVTDHIFCPTFIDDIAHTLPVLISGNGEGLYHVTGSQALSPYDATLLIAKTFGYETSLIEETTREKYFAGRAPRPFRLPMNNGKIGKLGARMKTFQVGLEEIKKTA